METLHADALASAQRGEVGDGEQSTALWRQVARQLGRGVVGRAVEVRQEVRGQQLAARDGRVRRDGTEAAEEGDKEVGGEGERWHRGGQG